MGSDEVWDQGGKPPFWRSHLAPQRDRTGSEPGRRCFYGPKLEFVLTDAIGGTGNAAPIQVDFVLPERLDANYIGEDGAKHRPVMLHRATLGSFERFIGILIESYAGKHCRCGSRTAAGRGGLDRLRCRCLSCMDVGEAELQEAAGVRAEADIRTEKINYKVREHSVGKVPVILAVGMKEVEDRTVSMRRLGEKHSKVVDLADVVSQLSEEAMAPDLKG